MYTLQSESLAHATSPPPLPVVLVVDDDPFVLPFITCILPRLGMRVLAADGGVAGLAAYREHKAVIDLVLTDVDMPGLDGLELLGAVRAIAPEARICLMTGGARDLPADVPVLRKPFTLAALTAMIAAVLH